MADVGIDPAFWRGRRVFVTGHTGFKGGWLSLWLKEMGAEVSGFALAPVTTPNLFELARVGYGMSHTLGDIRDFDALTAALDRAHPEIVLHLAAQSLVRDSYADPIGTFATNVMGTVHLLDAVRKCNQSWSRYALPTVRAVLVVTSDKCYENREWLWGYREDECLGGHDPYSASKACAEMVTAAYRRSFAMAESPPLGVASARAGNVIGGGDWAQDRLVPDAIRAFGEGKTLLVRNPSAVRPWQHVLDPLAGYLLLAQRLFAEPSEYAEAWNFGPSYDSERRVSELVELIVRAWGDSAKWQVDEGAQPHEALSLKLDSGKARALLAWRPRLTLEQAIEMTIEWYLAAQRGGKSLHDVTLRQIRAYALI